MQLFPLFIKFIYKLLSYTNLLTIERYSVFIFLTLYAHRRLHMLKYTICSYASSSKSRNQCSDLLSDFSANCGCLSLIISSVAKNEAFNVCSTVYSMWLNIQCVSKRRVQYECIFICDCYYIVCPYISQAG